MPIKYTAEDGRVLVAFVGADTEYGNAAKSIGLAPGSWEKITAEEAQKLMQPTPEEQLAATQREFTGIIQSYLDDFAKTRNYDGIMSVATYATSTVPKFKTEGQYAVEARDATWAKGYEIMADVLAGQRPMPTVDEVLAELPVLAWPEVTP